MSVVLALLKERSDPYTDFAYFGPYGARTLRKFFSTGLAFGPDDVLQRRKFRGPPSYEHWKACWAVFEVAMIMSKAATPAVLKVYGEFIESMHKQFGHCCWMVICQSEGRFRREQLEYLRRSESDALTSALAHGGSHAFGPEQPWGRCFDIAVDQYHYWNKSVTVPCLLIAAKAKAWGLLFGR